MLNNFFVADPAHLGSIDMRRGPSRTYPVVSARRIDPVKLLRLQSAIDGSSIAELLLAVDSLFIRGEDDGPWILAVPAPIASALAAADNDRLTELATAWASTPEWARDGGTASNLRPLLEALGRLTQRLTPPNALLMWASL